MAIVFLNRPKLLKHRQGITSIVAPNHEARQRNPAVPLVLPVHRTRQSQYSGEVGRMVAFDHLGDAFQDRLDFRASRFREEPVGMNTASRADNDTRQRQTGMTATLVRFVSATMVEVAP